MAKQVTDRLIKLTYRELVSAIHRAFPTLSVASVLLLAAHVAFETGMKYCHCYNLGNAKSSQGDGRDWVFFECGEEMPLSHAAREREKYPDLIIFKGVPYQRKGRWFQSITVKPPHPWSRFRAFDTLEAGVTDYVGLLRTARYTRAWEMLVDGTLVGFVEELEKAGYFTADLHEYLAGMRRSLLDVRGRLLGRPTLKMETRATQDKAQVEFWQREILGFGEGDVDGDFGPDTKKATSEWQKSHHLGGDGEVGPRSWATALPDAEVVL